MASTKRNVTAGQWSAFWRSLGIGVAKRQRFLKHYHPVRKDIAPLARVGVERDVVERVHSQLSTYKDPLLFHKFCQFFRRDPSAVQSWSGKTSISDAFEYYYAVFLRNTLPSLKKRFGELRLLSDLNRKGQGHKYEIKFHGRGSLANISGQQFTRRLNNYEANARYLPVDTFLYEGARIVCLRKRGQGADVFKFIVLRKRSRMVEAMVAADSKKEYALIRRALADYFNSYVDSPQIDAGLTTLRNFLRSGVSENFQLVGVTYVQDDFRIAVSPKFGRQINVTNHGPLTTYLNAHDPERVVVQMRILHTGLPGRVPASVDIHTSENSNVIGAIIFQLRDRYLNLHDRKQLTRDFARAFGFELGSFVSYDDLAEPEIYRRLLQTVGRKASGLELRSERALNIYKNLVSEGLIEQAWETQDEPAYCVNRGGCNLAFGAQRHRRHCRRCGERLLAGQAIVQPSVNEWKTALYLAARLGTLGLDVEAFAKKVLGRTYYVSLAQVDGVSTALVPVSSTLSANQLELLRLRIPNALVLTSRGNVEDYRLQNIECSSLHEFVSMLEQGRGQVVLHTIREVAHTSADRIRRYARDAMKRYGKADFYRDKNRQSKNLGAELFEADTFLLFRYVFRNSIWLGATQRGVPVPDGISAFPILDAGASGCLLWDSKYSNGNVRLGSLKKNQTYINAARRNDSIRQNGGLGGFVFVSNQEAPKTFEQRSKRLGGVRKPKITFLTAKQLLTVVKHFREHEDDILNNIGCHRQFCSSMEALFVSTVGGRKAFAITDEDIKAVVDENTKAYQQAKTQRMAL